MSTNATTGPRDMPLLRPSEVCERLAISRATFYRAVERGELPALRVLGQLRVDPGELTAWLYAEGGEDS